MINHYICITYLQSVCFTEKAMCGSICKGRAPALRCLYDPRKLMVQVSHISSARMII